jgi:transposase
MGLYAAFDLHANNSYLGIVNEEGKKVHKKKLPNEPEAIVRELESYRSDILGIAVESTFNWYWLVDLLQEIGYRMHLANPSAIQQYSGLKHVDDRHDAFWLAEMLRLGILPEGHICPKEDRAVRDLLRKRGHLVKLRTSLIISLQNTITRNCGIQVDANDIKILREDRISPLLRDNEDLQLSGVVSKEAIDSLSRQIRKIESVLVKRVALRPQYRNLLSIPGVGRILGLTIMLETGEIGRFAGAGNYASYCRKVNTKWLSNGKTKGKGNKKNGNKYLAWAFSEAAELARRYDSQAKAYFERKMRLTNRMVAHVALSHKLARAAYFIMRDGVEFQPQRIFG